MSLPIRVLKGVVEISLVRNLKVAPQIESCPTSFSVIRRFHRNRSTKKLGLGNAFVCHFDEFYGLTEAMTFVWKCQGNEKLVGQTKVAPRVFLSLIHI